MVYFYFLMCKYANMDWTEHEAVYTLHSN